MSLTYHSWMRLQICLIEVITTVQYAQTFVHVPHTPYVLVGDTFPLKKRYSKLSKNRL